MALNGENIVRFSLLDDDAERMKETGEISTDETRTHRVYARRWFVLAVLVLLNVANALAWNSFQTIANYSDEFYCTAKGCRATVWLIMIYAAVNIPIGALAIYTGDVYGVRTGLLCGCWLTLIGTTVRVVSTLDFCPVQLRFPVVLLGQFLAACAQPFGLYLPTKVAALWFAPSQRGAANALAANAVAVGAVGGLFCAPLFVNHYDDITLWLCITTLPALLVTGIATFGICHSVPPSPPSASAAIQSTSFWNGLIALGRNPSYLVLVFVFGGWMGGINCYIDFQQQILCVYGYSNVFAGIASLLSLGLSTLSIFVCSVIVDRTKQFLLVLRLCLLTGFLSTAFIVALNIFVGRTELLYAIGVSLFGMTAIGLYAVCLELAAEVAFPVAQMSSTGFMVMAMQAAGLAWYYLMPNIASVSSTELFPNQTCTVKAEESAVEVLNWNVPLYAWVGWCFVLFLITMLLFRPKLKRIETEADFASSAKEMTELKAEDTKE